MKRTVLLGVTLVLGGCIASPTVGEFSVGGTISGLEAEGALLADAGGAGVYVAKNGRFVIENAFIDGAAYQIEVAPDPKLVQTKCTVNQGRGTIRNANVDDVRVVCARTSFGVSGDVTGLTAVGLVLESHGAEIALSKDGRFVFAERLARGTTYRVTITQQPEGQTCTMQNGSGTLEQDVTNVRVTCA